MTEDGRSPVWVLMRVASLLTSQRLGTAAKSADNMTSPCLAALSSPDNAGKAARGNYFGTSIAAFISPGGKPFFQREREREKLRQMGPLSLPAGLCDRAIPKSPCALRDGKRGGSAQLDFAPPSRLFFRRSWLSLPAGPCHPERPWLLRVFPKPPTAL